MNNYIHLGPSEIVAGRSFTDPDQSRADAETLWRIADNLCRALNRLPEMPGQPRSSVDWQKFEGHDCRIIIANRERLLASNDLTIVGFFGQRRPDADLALLEGIDDELIGEFPQHPGVLSYCSLELGDGNWGNLVVFGFPEAREHWRTSERHAEAAGKLAPGYYATIRLHNAILPGGLMSGNDLILQRTKYYDFQGSSPWYAIREF